MAAGIEIAVGPAHGDLHPGNVLVAGTSPVIIDYGLSDESLPLGVDVARLFAGLVRNPLGALPMQELACILSETLGLAPKRSPLESPSERAGQFSKSFRNKPNGFRARITRYCGHIISMEPGLSV